MAIGRANNCPTITADTPALREVFTPGEHLLAVPPGDPDALAGAVVDLVGDPDLRERLARAGRARMEAKFTESALGRRLLDAIR